MALTRLEVAFIQLSACERILTGHDLGCCANCGHARMSGELSERPELAGYCFYSGEETDDAADSGELYIRFGARSSAEQAAVAETAVRVLRARGLQVDWDGDPECSILVHIPEEDLHFLEGLRLAAEEEEEEEEGSEDMREGDSAGEEDDEEVGDGEGDGATSNGDEAEVGRVGGALGLSWRSKRQRTGGAASLALPYASEAFELA